MISLRLCLLLLLCISPLWQSGFGTAQSQEQNENMAKGRAFQKEGRFLEALRQYRKIIQSQPPETLLVEAVYRFGESAEAAARELSQKAWQEVKPRRAGVYYDDDFIEWQGLQPYKDIGVDLRWSHLAQLYYYDGDAYREIVREYPTSEWADNAAFNLLLIKKKNVEWAGDPEGPISEINELDSLAVLYPNSDILPSILLLKARDLDYLEKLYSGSYRADMADVEMRLRYLTEKTEVLANIVNRFPESSEARKAQKMLEKLR